MAVQITASDRLVVETRPDPVRVLVLVQQRLLGEAVAHRLDAEPDLTVVRTLWDPSTLEQDVADLRPNVVVLDLRLVEGDITTLARTVRTAHPRARLVVLTGSATDRHVREAVEAGCSAFAMLDGSDVELVSAIHAAHAGEPHMDPELVASLVQRLDRSQRQATEELTVRELEVLGLLASGLGNAALASRLGLSVNTVRHHVQSILTKLGVHTKLQAVTAAIREGLVSPETL